MCVVFNVWIFSSLDASLPRAALHYLTLFFSSLKKKKSTLNEARDNVDDDDDGCNDDKRTMYTIFYEKMFNVWMETVSRTHTIGHKIRNKIYVDRRERERSERDIILKKFKEEERRETFLTNELAWLKCRCVCVDATHAYVWIYFAMIS